jgi:hypothetical protein
MIYKNKIVALYDQDDVCVFVTDDWQELADFLGKTVNSVQSSISHILKKTGGYERRTLIWDGKRLTPYLFDMDSNEEDF